MESALFIVLILHCSVPNGSNKYGNSLVYVTTLLYNVALFPFTFMYTTLEFV